MESLNIFLQAMHKRLGTLGTFIPRKVTTSSKFPAIKTIRLEVWDVINKDVRNLISTVQLTTRCVTDEEQKAAEYNVVEQTIENVLKYYGI